MASRTASAEEVEPEDGYAMAQPGKMAIQGALRIYFWESCRMLPPGRRGRRLPKTQEGERGLGQKHLGEIQTELDHDDRQAVGEHRAEYEAPARAPQRLGGRDVLLRNHAEGDPPGDPHDTRQVHDGGAR